MSFDLTGGGDPYDIYSIVVDRTYHRFGRGTRDTIYTLLYTCDMYIIIICIVVVHNIIYYYTCVNNAACDSSVKGSLEIDQKCLFATNDDDDHVYNIFIIIIIYFIIVQTLAAVVHNDVMCCG